MKIIERKKSGKFENFNKGNFLADPTQIDWYNCLKKYKNDTDLSYELFLRKIKFLYNKYSPLKTSKRKNKLDPSKSLLTPGLIKSIRIKNNLCKQFCQATNPAQRINLDQKLKYYRNQIVTLNSLRKENYFNAYREPKKNSGMI